MSSCFRWSYLVLRREDPLLVDCFIYCIDSSRNLTDWAGIYIVVYKLSSEMTWRIVSLLLLLLLSWRWCHLFDEPTALLPCGLSLWRSKSSELIDVTQLEICQVSLDSLLRAFLMLVLILVGIDRLIRGYRSIWNVVLLRIRCPQI